MVDDAIQAEGQATVRWRTVLECVEQEAKLELRFFVADAERLEDLFLNGRPVDTHRAATQFRTVQRQVVGLGQATAGIALQQCEVAVFRAGEGVVTGVQRRSASSIVEHREVHDPHRLPGVPFRKPFS
jgi:hypothetical protein